MKWPTKFKIGDVMYRVRFVKSIRGCKKSPHVKGSTVGLCDPNRKEILLKIGQTEDEILKSLLHELSHCFEEEYDIVLSHRAGYQLEEAVFDFICSNLQK